MTLTYLIMTGTVETHYGRGIPPSIKPQYTLTTRQVMYKTKEECESDAVLLSRKYTLSSIKCEEVK